ncbi:RNA polymerase sigma factor FliA [Piscinibacterium candidicorallinum]|jgi:RNA polymerase sigma factor for flagellar operon FliA|uniref:RNA polymerase sigma factor FliA n=1 Tax=Piscinibacterium candidicorallinum TaxID=1793872 RepID=A0ABV7HD21_9BURK
MYTATGLHDRETQLKKYQPMVRRLAHQMIAKLPANVELDDIVQAGMIGLMDALSRYELGHGTQFETYATQRIKGAMLDELRAGDWLPRSVRKSQRQIEQAIQKVEQRTHRQAQEAEIAKELGLSLDEYREQLSNAHGAQLFYLDDLSGDDDAEGFLDRHAVETAGSPLEALADERFRGALASAIESLPEREKNVMGMYYEHDMNLREIAAVLGVTESRVCQIHSQAVARLRTKLSAW